MNLENVTVEEMAEMYTCKDKAIVLNDGKVIGFVDKDE